MPILWKKALSKSYLELNSLQKSYWTHMSNLPLKVKLRAQKIGMFEIQYVPANSQPKISKLYIFTSLGHETYKLGQYYLK